MWEGWRSAGCATVICAKARPWPGAGSTGRSRGRRSPICTCRRRSSRVTTDLVGPGDIAAVAGFADITIGETLADPDDPIALPVITVDEPSLTMTIGINTSPLAGTDGTKVTARLLEEPPRRRDHRERLAAGDPGRALRQL